jgi:5-methylcytosine-specific restriction endonuclease McrA
LTVKVVAVADTGRSPCGEGSIGSGARGPAAIISDETKDEPMPRAPRLCACGKKVAYGQACPCQVRERVDTRPSASQRGYDAAWQRLSREFLRHHRLCAACARVGLITEARVVDHILPIHTHPHLRLDPANLQALCLSHNASKGHRQRREGGSSTFGDTTQTTRRPLPRNFRTDSIMTETDQSASNHHEFECEGLGSWL